MFVLLLVFFGDHKDISSDPQFFLIGIRIPYLGSDVGP
jgi:hypothetical protein